MFFFSVDLFWCWCSLVHFFFFEFIDFFSSRTSVWLFFDDFYLFVKLFSLSCIIFVLSHWNVILYFLVVHWPSLKQVFWILLVPRRLLLVLEDYCDPLMVVFPWFFMFLVIFHIWSSSRLLQSLLTAFRRGKTLISIHQ